MLTPHTLDFLSENRFQNSREWYRAHKEYFNAFVFAPLAELVNALAPTMEQIDSRIITEPKTDKTISRIYRDMRRAHGDFYRDEMWLSFKRDKHMFPRYPEFFFVFSPRRFFYGCGYYATPSDTMQCLRQMVVDDHPAYLAAQQAADTAQGFALSGDVYKRSKYPGQPPKKRDWLDRRDVCFMRAGDPVTDLFAPNLAEKLADAFWHLKPIYELCILAEQTANELRVDGGVLHNPSL